VGRDGAERPEDLDWRGMVVVCVVVVWVCWGEVQRVLCVADSEVWRWRCFAGRQVGDAGAILPLATALLASGTPG
jgi:hypothetical protein